MKQLHGNTFKQAYFRKIHDKVIVHSATTVNVYYIQGKVVRNFDSFYRISRNLFLQYFK